MHLTNIKFPIYAIGAYEKLWEENLILYLQANDDKIYIVDNKNLAGETLGERRFRISKEDRYKFVGTIFNIYQLINSKRKVFIDSVGKVFRYKRTKRADLLYRKIKKVKRIEDKGYLAYIEGISAPIIIPALFYTKQLYAGVLVYNGSYILYELTDEAKEDTWRKI